MLPVTEEILLNLNFIYNIWACLLSKLLTSHKNKEVKRASERVQRLRYMSCNWLTFIWSLEPLSSLTITRYISRGFWVWIDVDLKILKSHMWPSVIPCVTGAELRAPHSQLLALNTIQVGWELRITRKKPQASEYWTSFTKVWKTRSDLQLLAFIFFWCQIVKHNLECVIRLRGQYFGMPSET